jgi:hypothetical protein
MCFNSCSYAKFNPLEGEGSCTLPSDKTCPMDEVETTEEEEGEPCEK